MNKYLFIFCFFFWTGTAQAHGLTLTTAGVSVRNKTHLTVRLQYDPLLLWQRINPGAAPATLAAFANLPKADFEKGYSALKTYLEQGLSIGFNAQAVASMQFRFPASAEFLRTVRDRFMLRMMNAQGGSHHEDEDHRKYYQTVEIDGFLPADSIDGSLDIQFPPALGEVMVTFTRPDTQTLAPGKTGAHYHYQLKSGVQP